MAIVGWTIDDPFTRKLFNRQRARLILDHADIKRQFRHRAQSCSVLAFAFLVVFALTGFSFFGAIAILFFSTIIDEMRRMRACGRYWRCQRSIEVIGR